MNFILCQFCSDLGVTDDYLKVPTCTGCHLLFSTANFHFIQVVVLPYLSRQMSNYTAMCSFINISEQLEQKCSLVYCDECIHYIDFETSN